MARRAKFGRTPRVQQNLSSTLVSIAHEMVARQDQNLMDAWKNGGEFEGKKVTDEMVLAYWQKREKGLDKKDPLYDTYQDQIMQLNYGVEQSKEDLAHVQGKLSDTAYAQFFLKWAGKAPRNSEWWRTLQKDAAQLLENAKAKAKANSDKAKTDAFNAFVKDQNKDIGVGSALTDAMNQLSKDTGLTVTDNGPRLLQLLTEDYKNHPDKYHSLTDAMKTGGVSFGGEFTSAFFHTSLDNAEHAYDKVATRANKDGFASAYASATKGQADMGNWATNMKVWPVAKSYDRAYNLMMKTYGDPNASDMDKKAAAALFAQTVGTIAKTPGIDTASITMLNADAARALGKDAGDSPSFGASMLGHAGVTTDMQAAIAGQQLREDAMAQNPGAYSYAPVDKNGNFDPTGQGAVGIVPNSAIPPSAKFVAVPGLNGTARMVAIQPHDVLVNDPNNPDAQPTAIGKTMSYAVGGQTVTLYGYGDDQNGAHWSTRAPWAAGVTTATDEKGNTILTLPGAGATDPMAQAAKLEAQYPGLKLTDNIKLIANSTDPSVKASGETYTRNAKGQVTGHVEITYQPGKGFTLTQAEVVRDSTGKETLGNQVTAPIGNSTPGGLQAAALAPSVYTGGANVAGAFDSPAAASVDASVTHMSSGQMSALAADPNFQHAFLQQTMQTLGTTNPLDPRIAAAWDNATHTANTGMVAPGSDGKRVLPNGRVIDRTDLTLPGVAPKADPTKTSATISFGGQELKLPGLPAYLNNAQGQGPAVDLNGLNPLIKAGGSFLSQVLGFGAPAPAQPAGTPTAVNPATGFTVTPTAATPAPTATTPTTSSGGPTGVTGSTGGPQQGGGVGHGPLKL